MSIINKAKTSLKSFHIANGLFRRFVWSKIVFPEPEMRALNSLPKGTFDVAIDVGAAEGTYTWILNRKSQTVYAFEPGPILAKTVKGATVISRIKFTQAAVGDREGQSTLFTPPSGLFGSTLSTNTWVADDKSSQKNVVAVVTLDKNILDTLSSGRHVDFIKVDVEGFENEVISGAEKIISRFLPIILCEIEIRHNKNYSYIFENLHSRGYETYVLQSNGLVCVDVAKVEELQAAHDKSLPSGPFVSGKPSGYINNFLFIHPSSRSRSAVERAFQQMHAA